MDSRFCGNDKEETRMTEETGATEECKRVVEKDEKKCCETPPLKWLFTTSSK